jgi:hypothetical protein
MHKYIKNIDCLIAAIIGFYIIHLFAAYSGIGISPDSIMYASTAQNLHDHFSIITFNNSPLVFFPVFYPFFLSVCIFLSGGVDAVSAGPVINGLLFAAVIFLAGWLTVKFKAPSVVYKWLILAAVILSPGLQEIYMYLWSETLFILEILVFIIAFHNYLQTYSTRALIICGAITAIACITRYAGITIIGAGGLVILADGKPDIKKKLIHLFGFGAMGISLLVANLIMNAHNTGLSTGTREPSITPLKENMYYFGTVIIDWAGLPQSFYPAATALTAFVAAALVVLFVLRIIKKQVSTYETVIIAYALTYALFIVISATISRFERINSRLISPLYVPLLLSFTFWVPGFVEHLKFNKKWLATPFIVAMLAFEYSIYKTDADNYDSFKDYGIPGYTDDDWNKSDFVTFLRSHKYHFKPGYTIYTDADEAVYLFARIHSTLLPHRFFTGDVDKVYRQKRFYLIDFKKLENTELINIKDIQAHKKLTKLYDFADGAVYVCEGE